MLEPTRDQIQRFIRNPDNRGRILLSLTGAVEQPVFDTFLAHCNLPFIFEGAGTLSLALNLGKPYIRLLGNDQHKRYYPTPSEDHAFDRDIARLSMLGSDLALKCDKATSDNLYYYFLHTMLNKVESTRYFKRLRSYYHRVQMDKVFLALAAQAVIDHNLSAKQLHELLRALRLL
jgi:hypothetical protein